MILHETCTIEFWDGRQFPELDPVFINDIPCEVSPITSAQVAISAGSDLVRNDYLWVSTFDINAYWTTELEGETGYNKVRIHYRGNPLQVRGGFEIHRVLGRFHHTEAVIQDFGRFFTVQ